MTMATRVKSINIGPRQRQRRLAIGIVALLLGVALVVALIWLEAGAAWLLVAFVPFFVGLLGLVQAHECT
jgi:hypothetical protein